MARRFLLAVIFIVAAFCSGRGGALAESASAASSSSSLLSGLDVVDGGSVVVENDNILHDEDVKKRILLVSAAFRGHAIPLMNLAKELSDRGHEITFASQDDAEPWFRQIFLSDNNDGGGARFESMGKFPYSSTMLRSHFSYASKESTGIWGLLHLMNAVYMPLVLPMQDELMRILGIMSRAGSLPDIVVVDAGSLGALNAAQAHGIYAVVNSPTMFIDINLGMSVGHDGAMLPAWGTGFPVDMSLPDRVANVLFTRFLSVVFMPFFTYYNTLIRKLGLNPASSQSSIFSGHCVIVNSVFGIAHAVPQPPFVYTVGPLLPPEVLGKRAGDPSIAPSPLIEEWLTAGGDDVSVIYVSVGSMTALDRDRIDAIVGGLTHPSMRVLWMLSEHHRDKISAKLPPSFRAKTLGGIPHLKALAHPSVKAVVGHCGMASALEALHFGKPVVCLPLFVDQLDVSRRVEEWGAGKTLSAADLSSQSLRMAVHEMISNSTFYSARAAALGERIRRSGGTFRAADIVENMMHYGDAKAHLGYPKYAWHRQKMMDVYMVLFAFVCVVAAVVRVLSVGLSRIARKAYARAYPRKSDDDDESSESAASEAESIPVSSEPRLREESDGPE